MGLLDGDLVPVVGAAFGWVMLPALLHRRELVSDGKGGFVEGEDGDFAAPEAIKVIVTDATEDMRREADFQETDISILVLAFNPDAGSPVLPLGVDDEMTIQTGPHAGRYHVMPPLGRDPAGTYWTGRGRPV